jgi:hypothetical protein
MPTAPTLDDASPRSRGGLAAWQILGLAMLVPVAAIYLVDRFQSNTALITPIGAVALDAGRAAGAAVGQVFGLGLAAAPSIRGYRKLVLPWVCAFGGYAFGDGLAWRIAEHRAFPAGNAGFAAAHYPIVNLKGGGKSGRYTLGIDPYATGEPAGIEIPRAQYHALRDSGWRGFCVTVAARRNAAGAVEIRTDPFNPGFNGEAEVTSCGSASGWGTN